MSTRIRNHVELERCHDILDAIAFHPDISWRLDQYVGGSQIYGTSRHVQVNFSWEIPDPRNQPTGREGYHMTEIVTSDEIHAMDDEGLKRRLLDIHHSLWRSVSELWSQTKPGRHLRSVDLVGS